MMGDGDRKALVVAVVVVVVVVAVVAGMVTLKPWMGADCIPSS